MKASGGRRGIRCCIEEQRALAVVACIIQSSVGVVNEVAIITVIGGLHGDEIAVVIIGVLEGLFEVAHRSIFALLFGHIAMLIVFGRDLTALTKIISGLVVARALVIHNVICTIFADSFDVQAIDIHGIEIAGRGLDTAIIRDNFRDGQLMGIIIGIGGGVVQILLTITYGVGLFAQFPAVVIIGVLAHDGRIAKDRFKFEAAHKAGYAMIRVLEPGLEVLDQKYDIVIPEGFKHGNAYVPEIMEEVGRKVIHLLEEIYGRKASPEIWALNNFKEFEAWYDANKKELEANAKKRGPKGKTAVKKAA